MQTAKPDPSPSAAASIASPISPTVVTPSDLAATVQALKARGAERFDPIGLLCVDAMIRRAASCSGPARAAVLARVRQRLDALTVCIEHASAPPYRPPAPQRGALAELLAHVCAHEAVHDAATGPVPGVLPVHSATAPPARELKSLRYFRDTWARLSVDSRLRQSLAALPDNAGPLNSQRLVHLALNTMRDLSPAYLEHFIEHVDTLLWLDEAVGALPSAGKAVLHPDSDKAVKPESRRGRR